MASQKRKPGAGGTGSRENESLARLQFSQDSKPPLQLQAARLVARFGLTEPHAQLVAELAFAAVVLR